MHNRKPFSSDDVDSFLVDVAVVVAIVVVMVIAVSWSGVVDAQQRVAGYDDGTNDERIIRAQELQDAAITLLQTERWLYVPRERLFVLMTRAHYAIRNSVGACDLPAIDRASDRVGRVIRLTIGRNSDDLMRTTFMAQATLTLLLEAREECTRASVSHDH